MTIGIVAPPTNRSPAARIAHLDHLITQTCDVGWITDAALCARLHALARVFRRYLGCSPGEYLRQRRLARASMLLRETERPLSDVAASSGYVDQSHFAKAVKSATGLTPRM